MQSIFMLLSFLVHLPIAVMQATILQKNNTENITLLKQETTTH